MICAAEAKSDIAASVGIDTIAPLKPTWDQAQRIYACDYIYRGGATLSLSVKEAKTAGAAAEYFALLGHRLGKQRTLHGLGEAAFVTPRWRGIVARRGDKVLLVDASKLPARFGRITRSDIATMVAEVTMSCWGGGECFGLFGKT
jgi:hypothetical protein